MPRSAARGRDGQTVRDPDDELYSDQDAGRTSPPSRNDTGLGQLIPPAFIRQVANGVISFYKLQSKPVQTEIRGSLSKFWFGPDPHIHYEVWVHARTNQLELGLHCESTPEYNRGLYAAFDRCILEIQQQLGSQFWLEDWDNGWVRMYETHPLYPMDSVRVEEIALRIGEIIAVLQPIYEDIAAELTPPSFVPNVKRGHARRSHR